MTVTQVYNSAHGCRGRKQTCSESSDMRAIHIQEGCMLLPFFVILVHNKKNTNYRDSTRYQKLSCTLTVLHSTTKYIPTIQTHKNWSILKA